MGADARSRARPEAWVFAAWSVLAAEVALAIYLGLKFPGANPAKAYTFGPWLLVGAAFAVGIAGAAVSLARRPIANPYRLVAFCVLGFVIASVGFPLPFPSYRAGRPSPVAFQLPFQGEWTVAWGGADDQSHHLLRARPDRRFAYFFVVERDGATRREAADPRSAFAFGSQVLSPCDGQVVAATGELADDGPASRDDLGNHVVIEVAPAEYLFLTNLKQGSLAVRAGERVVRGQALARVGWSARTPLAPEPHLAMHLQDTPQPWWGQAIPFDFRDYFVGERRIERGLPRGAGYFVGRPLEGERLRTD